MFDAPKDYLTHCYAREGLQPFLRKMEEDFTLYKKPFTVLIVDVDHFKSFNDKYGHLNGDEVLKYFSSSMRLDLEDEENQPFRFGGDEFVMVFPNKTSAEAYRLAARLRRNIKTRSCLIKGKQLNITFSGGIASYPRDAKTTEELLEKADKALYYSKNHGRRRTTRCDEIAFHKMVRILLYILVILGGLFAADLLTQDFAAEMQKFNSWRQGLLQKISRYKSPISPLAAPTASSPAPASVTPTPSPRARVAVPPSQEPAIGKIYLKSGRMIQGTILTERPEEIEVGLGLQEGKGSLRFKKSQISKIETGSQTRNFD